jgi:hypothetical protein
MRLLLLGSLLVMLSVVVWAATNWTIFVLAHAAPTAPVLPVFGFVSPGRTANGANPDAVVWQTSRGRADCSEVIDRRRHDAGRKLAALLSSASDSSPDGEDDKVCEPFQLGEIEHGVKVEIVGDCGPMARIRILSGRFAGRLGCIDNDRLSAEAASTRASS